MGRQLALAVKLPFVDLDAEIEKKEGKAIPDIFSEHGESYFRVLESELLQSWANSPGSFVMATGGGTPCFHEGIVHINNSGWSIFLDVSVENLVRRLEEENHRPLLEAADRRQRLEELRDARLPFYKQAKLLMVEPFTLSDILEVLPSRR